MADDLHAENFIPTVGDPLIDYCPRCHTMALQTNTIYAITSEASQVIGGYAVCGDCGWSPYPADQAWRERAETAEKALKEALQTSRNYQILYADEVKSRMEAQHRMARVRALAEEWTELAERGDPCAERVDLAIADCGRDVLAALDSQEAASVPPETPKEDPDA